VKPIDESKKCHLLTKSCLEKVRDFREASKQYYRDIQEKRFPPSYYLANGTTKTIGDMLEKICISPDCRILTGYNPMKQLAILGFEDKDFDDYLINQYLTFENTVTVLVPKSSLIVINIVVDESDAIEVKSELKKCNDFMKAVYAINHKYISHQFVTVVGTIIFSSISSEQMQTKYFPFLNLFNGNCRKHQNVIFLCKQHVYSIKCLQDWWKNLCKVTCTKPPRHLEQQSQQAIHDVTGEMMASMSMVSSYLPRVTSDVGEKIATLLLNPSQVDVVLNDDQWKVIRGCFGSGKSICIKEIARRLHSRNDG